MSRDRDWYEKWENLADREPSLLPAATVLLLRDGLSGPEVLLVRHARSDRFVSGVWAFPGGQVEDVDTQGETNRFSPSVGRTAAARETAEEVDLVVDPQSLEVLSLWIPPRSAPKRYSTWFFVAAAPAGVAEPDGAEITDHVWTTPAEAFSRRDAGEIRLLPPTYLSLIDLAGHDDVASVLAHAEKREPPTYRTNLVLIADGAVAMWEGDAGWESGDIDVSGSRHRLWMRDAAWRLEIS